METFYIEVALGRGLTRIQVDEVLPEDWDVPGAPQFVIEYFSSPRFLTLTIRLANGCWHDRNTRLTEDEYFLRYDELGPGQAWNPDYHCPLSPRELQAIGMAISNHMVIYLSAYLGLLMPQYRTPTLN